jgi:hypothetical protein
MSIGRTDARMFVVIADYVLSVTKTVDNRAEFAVVQ